MSGVIKVLTKMLQYFDHTQLIGCHLKITDAINMFHPLDFSLFAA